MNNEEKDQKKDDFKIVFSLPEFLDTKSNGSSISRMEVRNTIDEIGKSLERYYSVFYTLWQLGYPVIFSDPSQTKIAYVTWNVNTDSFEFFFEENFWNNSSIEEKTFIVCHEILHVIFYHFTRIEDYITHTVNDVKTIDQSKLVIANIASDLITNHTLVDIFRFQRSELKITEKMCFTDTVFKDTDFKKYNLPYKTCQDIPTDENMEFYLDLLEKIVEKNTGCSGTSTGSSEGPNDSIDDHGKFYSSGNDNGMSSGEINKIIEDKINSKINESYSDKEIEKMIQDFKQLDNNSKLVSKSAGVTPGNCIFQVKKKKVIKKRKFEDVIDCFIKHKIGKSDKAVEQWARRSRRMQNISRNFFLPCELEHDDLNKEKMRVMFFQDTSGSCKSYATRFFNIADSIPKDKFDVELFCFDVRVYKTDFITRKLYGFGGTSFICIEDYIQSLIKQEHRKYPTVVFVVTDGEGDKVVPQFPRNWYWILLGDEKSCIPKESHVFDISVFE